MARLDLSRIAELDVEADTARHGCEWRTKSKSRILASLLRLLRRTWRVRICGLETFRSLYSGGNPFILCFWHGKYVPVIPLFEGYSAVVLTSRSRRGDVLMEVFSNFGYDSIQIPDRGGEDSLRIMEGLSRARAVAIAVDGPFGPYHLVKRGVIRLASDAGFMLLPLSLDVQPCIVLRGRWDRMEIPLPFSRICLTIGTPVGPPGGRLSRQETDSWASMLSQTMEEMEKENRQARYTR